MHLWNRAVTIIVVATAITAASAQSRDKPQSRQEQQVAAAMQHLKDADYLSKKGDYVQAEAVARTSIEELDAAGHSSWVAHITLGRILMRDRRYDDALPELGYGWKTGKNERQDLLIAIDGSRHSDSQKRNLAYGSLGFYLNFRKKLIAERLGDQEFDLYNSDPQYVSGVAALLFAADPAASTDDAMEFLAEADHALPKHPAVAYVRGLTYLRMNRKSDAKRDLQFAAAHAKGKLGEMANAQLGRMGAVQG